MITNKLFIPSASTTLKNGLYGVDEFDEGWSLMGPLDGSIGIYPGKMGNCTQGNGTMFTYMDHIFGGYMTQPASTISFWLDGYVAFTGRNYYDSGHFAIIVNPSAGITVIFEDAHGNFVRRVYYDWWNYGNWHHFVFNFFPIHPYPYIVDVYMDSWPRNMNNEDFGSEISPFYDYGQDCLVTLNGKLDQYAVWQAYRYMGQDEVSMLYNIGNGLPYSQW